MPPENNYLDTNRKTWNEKTRVHLESAFYDVPGFLEGKSSLNEIELGLLGDVTGKSILHLQCHFGQDTLSLARLGAQVTGVDLSDAAIAAARTLAQQTGLEAEFICSDVYALPSRLNEQFDIVFTSYGVIGWLPDLDKWAKVVAKFLKPGGRFVFVEFHPVVWMFDMNFERIAYRYFNSGAIVEKEQGTYADRQADLQPLTITWNHSLADVVNSLIVSGLEINTLNEYDYSPQNCFLPNVEAAPGKYRIGHLNDFIPMTFSVVATKKNQ
jgi:2-polyprenyl-3-methyl-5-hydroxy-6-metoxy-1,4-benzoquinol methylase